MRLVRRNQVQPAPSISTSATAEPWPGSEPSTSAAARPAPQPGASKAEQQDWFLSSTAQLVKELMVESSDEGQEGKVRMALRDVMVAMHLLLYGAVDSSPRPVGAVLPKPDSSNSPLHACQAISSFAGCCTALPYCGPVFAVICVVMGRVASYLSLNDASFKLFIDIVMLFEVLLPLAFADKDQEKFLDITSGQLHIYSLHSALKAALGVIEEERPRGDAAAPVVSSWWCCGDGAADATAVMMKFVAAANSNSLLSDVAGAAAALSKARHEFLEMVHADKLSAVTTANIKNMEVGGSWFILRGENNAVRMFSGLKPEAGDMMCMDATSGKRCGSVASRQMKGRGMDVATDKTVLDVHAHVNLCEEHSMQLGKNFPGLQAIAPRASAPSYGQEVRVPRYPQPQPQPSKGKPVVRTYTAHKPDGDDPICMDLTNGKRCEEIATKEFKGKTWDMLTEQEEEVCLRVCGRYHGKRSGQLETYFGDLVMTAAEV
ncbi:hypothetical protein FOA52_014071 [Chlamydomonas sp. UWO 241]|nr:hypothetical protein FOA52_014071 [Chlamydomonas sp. UWO 241]